MSNQILLNQTTSDELARLIFEVVKSQFDDLKKDLLSNKANDELLTRGGKITCNPIPIIKYIIE